MSIKNISKRWYVVSAIVILVFVFSAINDGNKPDLPSINDAPAFSQLPVISTTTASPVPYYKPITQPQLIEVKQERIPSQVVIQFAPDSTAEERTAYIESVGGTVVENIESLDTVVVTVSEEVAQEPLPESPAVTETEPDYYVTALDDVVPPNDPRYPEQWALPAIGAPSAWAQLPADAPKVTVAVIDSGICASHPDLTGRIIDGWDFLESDAVPQDDFGHGCSVSGVIAANMNDGIGIAGVAPNAQIMPLRVLNASGVGSYSDVAAAIVYAADNSAQVINLSLGGSNPSTTLENAVNYAISKGLIVVAAAGNSGTEGALYPAAYPDVIAVGSVDPNLQYSSFSNYGSQIDIWAPGRDILTTKRDGGYELVSGTSFAAPYVAGAEVITFTFGETLIAKGTILVIDSKPNLSLEAPPSTGVPFISPILPKNPLPDQTNELYLWSPVDNIVLYKALNSNRGGPGLQPYDLLLYNAETGITKTLISDGYSGPAKFSSDGLTIAFWYNTIPSIARLDNEEILLNPINTDFTPVKGVFSSQNDLLIYATVTNEIRIRDLENGIETSLGSFDDVSALPALFPELDPSDQWVAFSTGSNVTLIDTQQNNDPILLSGFDMPQTEISSTTHYFIWSENGNSLYNYKFKELYSFKSDNAPSPVPVPKYSSFDGMYEVLKVDGELFMSHSSSGTKKQLTNNIEIIDRMLLQEAQTAPEVFTQAIADGFDFPVGKPNGSGYYVALDFNQPYNGTYHPGEDWNGNGGTDTDRYDPVYSVANGKVIDSNFYSTWGNIVLIEHTLPGGKKLWSQYAHLERRDVGINQEVNKGQQIGTIGKGDGNIYLAHLHFEIRTQYRSSSAWISGWTQDQIRQYYTDPTDYINSHRNIGGGTTPPQEQCSSYSFNGITLFNDIECRGSTAVQINSTGFRNLDSSNNFNDQTRSINVASNWSVRIWEHNDRGGATTCITGDKWDLTKDKYDNGRIIYGDNANISSIQVFNNSTCYEAPQGPSTPSLVSPSADQNIPNSQNVTFDWSDSGDSYTFDLTGGPSAANKAGINGSSFNFGTLWPGAYQWRVTAYRNNQSATSGWRNLYVRPNTPNSISVATNSTSTLTVNWGDSAGIDGYKVYRNGSLIQTVGGGTHSYQDTGRSCGTTYSYTVRAYKGSLESDPASANGTTSACPVAPTTPIIYSPVHRAILVYPVTITFDWSDSGDTYDFYFGGNSGYVDRPNLTSSSTTVTSLQAGFSEWKVTAKRNGQTAATGWIDLYIVPSTPGSVNVTTNSTSAVTVNWTASSGGVDGYKIYRNNTLIQTVGPTTYSYQDTGLSCDNTSTYSVAGYKGIGTIERTESPRKNAVGSTSPCPVGPTVPTLLSPANGSSIPNPQSVTFDWSASGDSYTIEITGGPSAGTTNVTPDSLNFGSMWPGVYQWRVKAYRNGLWSAWSNTWTLNVPPGEPGSVSTTPNSTSAVTVNWTNSPGGVDGYKVYRNGSLVTTVGGSTYSYQVTGLSCEDTSTYGVIGYKGTLDSAAKSASGTTSDCIRTVRVVDVFTTDQNGMAASLEAGPRISPEDVQAKAITTNFNAGDEIQLFIQVENQYSTTQTAYFEWFVYDPAWVEVPALEWSGTLSTSPGTIDWRLPRTIPTEALNGDYTFVGEITFSDSSTWDSYDFNVANGLNTIEVIDVYTTDENGTAASLSNGLTQGVPQDNSKNDVESNAIKTTFNAGDPIQLYIDYYNNVSAVEIASYEWSVIDPSGRWVPGLSHSSDESNDLGGGWWRLDGTIPANAITGTYTFTGLITYNNRTTSDTSTFLVNGPAGPTNDGFATPKIISTVPYINSMDTWGATTAFTDPTPTCASGQNSNSVWYAYTAPANGLLEIDTWGSDYDTVLAIWTGSINNLTLIDCNDDSDGYYQALLAGAPVTAGTTYYIEVMDYGTPGGGNMELSVDFAELISNNDFNTPTMISAMPYNTTLDTRGATQAFDDPSLTTCNRLPGQASVWYRYTPIWNGELQLDTVGSDYDTLLAVWTGTRGNLTSVGCNDDIGDVDGDWDQDSDLTASLTGGTTYYIEVSTFAGMIDINGASAAETQNKPDMDNASANRLQQKKTEIDNGNGVITGQEQNRNDDISAQFWGGQLQLHAAFTINTQPLTVENTGTGSGTVTSSPAGIDCGLDCSESYADNTVVTLTASPASNYHRFTGWSGGGCSGTDTCAVTMDATKTVTAGFEPATFTDVPFNYSETLGGISYPLHDYIEALWDAGFTKGCQTPGEPFPFCPDQLMTRLESAVFMLRGNFGSDYVPPVAPWDTFSDDWGSGDPEDWKTKAEKWAEGMWQAGLSAGCQEPADNPVKLFCPWDPFPRVEASVFGLRLKYGADYGTPAQPGTPPPATGTLFADFSDVNFYGTKWAEQAYLDGLLPSCGTQDGKPLFCPYDSVDRAWAAYLIVKAKDLPLP